MPPKDYVSRKPVNKNKPPQTVRKFPLVPIIIAIGIIGVFIGALFFLNNQTPESAPVIKTPQKKPDALPEVPEEQWEYVESLPNQTVPVEVPEQVDSGKRYRLQCGSFRTHGQAEQMKARLAFQGLSANIQETNGSSGKWFRVILGPFDSKRDAERDRHAARRASVTTCQMREIKT